MSEQIELAGHVVGIVFCAAMLVIAGAVIYGLIWCGRLSRQVRGWRDGPEVARDGAGRPLRERK